MNDSSWRTLSAVLGVACVILIIAAGALLATTGESAPPTPGPSDTAIVGSPSPSGVAPTDSNVPPDTPTPTATATVAPTPTPTAPAKAPIVSVTFNNLMLDASTNALGTARTITFITDGTGPVKIAITKSPKALTYICVKLDENKPDCRKGTTSIKYNGSTDTVHSLWTVTLVGYQSNTPTIDLAMSWPSNTGKVSFTHGRLQGSTTPGVPDALNGFTATFKTRTAGNVTLGAAWTLVTANIDVSLADVDGPKAIAVDDKQFPAAQNLGTSGYSFGSARASTTGSSYATRPPTPSGPTCPRC